jgi:hypothetical protein
MVRSFLAQLHVGFDDVIHAEIQHIVNEITSRLYSTDDNASRQPNNQRPIDEL